MFNSAIGFAIKQRWVRLLLEKMHFREMAGFVLKKNPISRHIGNTNVIYRMASLDSLLVSREIFSENAYHGLHSVEDVRTFADLGSNCGYFACWLAAATNNTNLKGLLIEANPEMVAESKWHVEKNGLTTVDVCWGIVGGDTAKESETFYVHPSAAGSSRFAKSPAEYVTQNKWQPIQVPNVSLAREWDKRFPAIPCDLLKIDIEGSELDFLSRETGFLKNVRAILIEIHHWIVDTTEVEKLLLRAGFELTQTLTSDSNADVRLYKNTALSFSSTNGTAS